MKMRRTLLVLSSLAFGVVLTACKSCVDQHNPRQDQAMFKQEETFAKAEQTLTPEGTIPVPVAATTGGAPQSVGQQKFEQFCAACHGIDGKADGPGAAGLNPKPRNFTDVAWQGKVDDAHIHKVIKEGGASVGLSATMAPWGGALNDAEIDEVTKWVRHFKGK
ncbi:MAG: cytochrome c [Proteobacteria bacterium]|nr:MAG: cytochrome c [Pseudomonadota bacterium]